MDIDCNLYFCHTKKKKKENEKNPSIISTWTPCEGDPEIDVNLTGENSFDFLGHWQQIEKSFL